MSGFYNEILLKLGLSPEELVGAKITVIDLKGAFVEGHGGLISYSPEEIKLKFKRRVLAVKGIGMTVAAISKDELFIKGKIFACEVESDG